MSFRLQKEAGSAAQRIEAAVFATSADRGAGDQSQLLEWKGNEATENLAKAQIQSRGDREQQNGLPLILGQ
jgi:hypothetical protein